MSRTLFTSIAAIAMASYLVAACADNSEATAQTGSAPAQEALAGNPESTEVAGDSLMDQPVDFSTPEAVEKTLQNIREQEGEGAYSNLKGAMSYILYYDLSLRNDRAKLHAKLDGQTPNQIIADMKRRTGR